MELMDKSAIVAEIEKKIKEIDEIGTYLSPKGILTNLLCHINTLEVKEVDLEKALSDLDKDIKEFVTTEEFEKDSAIYGHYWAIAKHAFLLGLKAQKEE